MRVRMAMPVVDQRRSAVVASMVDAVVRIAQLELASISPRRDTACDTNSCPLVPLKS